MKVFVRNIAANPRYSKVIEWGKLVTLTGSAQLLIQGIGFACGILVIRLLSTQEYALFILANTMLGAMTMLADSGISNGIMAESGKVWQEKDKLGDVLATGLSLRKQFGIISLIITLPVLGYMLIMHGASWLMVALIVAAVIPAFFAALSDSILEIVPRLHQDVKPLQRNQIEVAIGRLIITGLFLFIFPFASFALIANGIPRIYGNLKLSSIAARHVSEYGRPDPQVRKAIMKGVKRTLPIVVYHCISGQISIWLISIFGATESIAQIGALGRLSIIFSLFTSVFSTLVVPRFSRMIESKKELLTKFLLIQLITLTISSTLLLCIWLFSDQILWVLGKKYFGLNHQLLLVGAINCVGLLGVVCSQLILSRGWFLKPYFLISLNFFSTIIGFAFFNIHTLIGILNFTLGLSFVAFLMDFTYGIISIYKIPKQNLQ